MAGPEEAKTPPAAYVNYLRVAHQRSEFYLVFGQLAQEPDTEAHLLASLVTSPGHARAMLRVLSEAVERYEERFGPIAPPPTPIAGAAAAASSAPRPVGPAAAGAARKR